MSKPLWQQPSTGFGSGSGGFAPTGLKGYSGSSSYGPSAPSGPEDVGPDSGNTPGTYNLNPLDPANSLKQAGVETGDFWGGLRAAIFGADKADAQGNHGGLLGGVPVLSDLARAGTGAIGAVGGAVLGLGGNLIEGTAGLLEHLPSFGAADPATGEFIRDVFNRLPAESEAKQRALQKIAEAEGQLIGPAYDYIYSQALRDAQLEDWFPATNPYLGLYSPSNTVMGDIDNLFLGGLGFLQRSAERGLAGAALPWDQNRLDHIMKVGDGEAEFYDPLLNGVIIKTLTGGDGGKDTQLNAVEQRVYDEVKSGNWSESEALDYLAAHGSGLSHSAWAQVAGSVVTDPLMLASIGAAGLSAAAKAGTAGRVAAQLGGDATRAQRIFAAVMPELQNTSIGKVSKIARTVIDPFHALDLGRLGPSKMVDLHTELTTRVVVDTYGAVAHLQLLTALDNISPAVRSAFERGMSTYAANTARRVVGRRLRETILLAGEEDATRLLASGMTPTEVVEGIFAKPQVRGVLDEIANEAVAVAERNWDATADTNLARRLTRTFGEKSEEDWRLIVGSLNDQQKSMLHAATYGKTTDRLLELRAALSRAGWDKAHRLVLLNKQTLTKQGAGGLIERIQKAADGEAIEAIIREAKELYPELRVFTQEGAASTERGQRFIGMLNRKMDHLPMQAVDDEIDKFADLRAYVDDTNDAWTVGFAPEDEYKWGLSRVSEDGMLAPTHEVWVDHVGLPADGLGYQGARHLTFNFRGQPIVGHAGQLLLKPVDYLEAGRRALVQGVTGTMIATAARQRFVGAAVSKWRFTDEEARAVINALEDVTQNNRNVVNPRGMHAADMWNAARAAIPDRLRNEGFTQRDLLRLVLEAYEGDVRFVGLTQKFTGRVKRAFADLTGTNYIGQIAENLYPAVKFRFNLVFQTQERVEPWVLNAMRGVAPAIGATIQGGDVATSRFFQNMVNRSLVRMADLDQYEYSAQVLASRELGRRAADGSTALGRFVQATTDVQGSKHLNMLRTFAKGVGKDFRESYEQLDPGAWNRMIADASKRAKRLVSDDELAMQIMAQNIEHNRLATAFASGSADLREAFVNLVAKGTWNAPADLGDLRPLMLDHLVDIARFTDSNGKVLADLKAVRAALTDKRLKIEQITDYLGMMGADPDYIARVASAFDFHWEGFFATVTERFNLTGAQSRALQDGLAEAARLRNMTPVEYVSQVLSPSIVGGDDARIGMLGALGDMMVGGKLVKRPQLGQLAARTDAITGKYISNRADLTRQLGSIWAKHLDPSAKRALIMEFKPELRQAILDGTLDWDLNELDQVFNSPEVQSALMDALHGHVLGSAEDYRAAMVPRTPEEYRAMYPDHASDVIVGHDPLDGNPVRITTRRIGDEFFAPDVDEAGRTEVISELGRLQDQFPTVPIQHTGMDPASFRPGGRVSDTTMAYTIGAQNHVASFILNPKLFGGTKSQRKAAWKMFQEGSEAFRTSPDTNMFDLAGKFIGRAPRRSYKGVPYNYNVGPGSTIRHEFMHALDGQMRKDMNVEYIDFVHDYYQSRAAKMVSEYGMTDEEEAMSELFAVMTDPNFDPDSPFWKSFELQNQKADLAEWHRIAEATEWKYVHQSVIDSLPEHERVGLKAWNPKDQKAINRVVRKAFGPDLPADMLPGNALMTGRGPQTVPEAVEQLRDILQRAGAYTPPAPRTTNADLIRIYRHFDRWSGRVTSQALDPEVRNFSLGLGLRNTEQAVPFSATEAALMNAVSESAVEKMKDAYKLQYFKQKRSMLERSINHPMFGLYPASYMWGKIAPEMVRFIATQPFGIRTGAMGRALVDIQTEVGTQREFDPEFDALIEGIGHSDALWFLGYMLPATPWDLGAAFPTWMRDIAAQGNEITEAIETGQSPEDVDVVRSAMKSGELLNPLRPVKQVTRAASDFNDFLNQEPDTEAQPGPAQYVGDATQATELENPLQQAYDELASSLFRR